MKQKIIISVPAMDEEGRATAMKTVVEFRGVESVAVGGSDRRQLVVVGVGVDATEMTKKLRKRVTHAVLESVTPMAEETSAKKEHPNSPPLYPPYSGYPPPDFMHRRRDYEPDDNCTVM